MEFSESSHIKAIREGVRDVTRRFPVDYWNRKDEEHAFPEEFWKALGEGGWLGVVISPVYGGSGLGTLEMACVIEEMCAGGAGVTGGLLFVLSSVFGALSIGQHGTEIQRRRYLPRLTDGTLEFAMALTEPDAGSNLSRIRTMAERVNGGWRLNGSKVFITNIDRAGAALIVGRTRRWDAERPRTDGLSLFILDSPAATRGVHIQPLSKMGISSLKSFLVTFDDVYLPDEALLGQEGAGWEQIFTVLNPERIAIASIAIGTGELALQTAVRYAAERVVFDRPIGAHQGISFPLARAKCQLEAARMLNYKAAWLFDQRQPCAAEANMAKFLATEAAWNACDQAVQVHGGYGYVRDYHVERYLRDMRLLRVAPITSEMTLNYVAEHVLGLPRSY